LNPAASNTARQTPKGSHADRLFVLATETEGVAASVFYPAHPSPFFKPLRCLSAPIGLHRVTALPVARNGTRIRNLQEWRGKMENNQDTEAKGVIGKII
jgi:hypothetical protein